MSRAHALAATFVVIAACGGKSTVAGSDAGGVSGTSGTSGGGGSGATGGTGNAGAGGTANAGTGGTAIDGGAAGGAAGSGGISIDGGVRKSCAIGGQPCTDFHECCSELCDNGTCRICGRGGGGCIAETCCGGPCNYNVCACRKTGETCHNDAWCCAGICVQLPGDFPRCVVP